MPAVDFTGRFRDKGGNPDPQAMTMYGPVVRVEIQVPSVIAALLTKAGAPIPPGRAGWGMIDTGATHTAADSVALQELGIPPVSKATVHTASGPVDQFEYPARIWFPEWEFAWEAEGVTGASLRSIQIPVPHPFEGGDTVASQVQAKPLLALIGRHILEQGVFTYDGPNATWHFQMSGEMPKGAEPGC